MNESNIAWPIMSLDEFAALQQAMGACLCRINGIWWHAGHGVFWRPLDPFAPLNPNEVVLPRRAWAGAVLHPVNDPRQGNAFDQLFVHEELQGYALERLSDKRKSETRQGLKHFTARPITQVSFFVGHAHGLFRDFRARTMYTYKSERVHADAFARWAETLFSQPKVVVLGAFQRDVLKAVDVSCRVEDTIFDLTFFSDTATLKLHVADFMLHTLRQAAAATDARRIYRGRPTGNPGVDRAKIIRGCRLLELPARLHASPLALWVLRLVRPELCRRLTGT